MRLLRFLIPVSALAFGSVGCADPCLAVCEEVRGCPDADTEVDCEELCAEAAEQAGSCEAELEAVQECEATQVDVCAPIVELCAAEATALQACVGPTK